MTLSVGNESVTGKLVELLIHRHKSLGDVHSGGIIGRIFETERNHDAPDRALSTGRVEKAPEQVHRGGLVERHLEDLLRLLLLLVVQFPEDFAHDPVRLGRAGKKHRRVHHLELLGSESGEVLIPALELGFILPDQLADEGDQSGARVLVVESAIGGPVLHPRDKLFGRGILVVKLEPVLFRFIFRGIL